MQYSNSPSNFKKQTTQPQKDSQFSIHLPHHQEPSGSVPADCLCSNLQNRTGLNIVLCMNRMKDCRDCRGDSTMWFDSVKATDKKEKVFTNAVFFTQNEKKNKKRTKQNPKSFFCPSWFKLNWRNKQQLIRYSVIGFFPKEYQYVIATDAASLDETWS